LATRHSAPPETEIEAVVADADLSVLGASSSVYDAYARGIAEEYAFAGREAFAAGRAAFLESMLGRGRLFHTERGHALWDAGARRNIWRELDGLRREA
jgi:predicted metal-dependent HD superfamily phosphohydrolase